MRAIVKVVIFVVPSLLNEMWVWMRMPLDFAGRMFMVGEELRPCSFLVHARCVTYAYVVLFFTSSSELISLLSLLFVGSAEMVTAAPVAVHRTRSHLHVLCLFVRISPSLRVSVSPSVSLCLRVSVLKPFWLKWHLFSSGICSHKCARS